MMIILAAGAAHAGLKTGIFAPEHKQLAEPYEELLEILAPIRLRSSRTEGLIRTTTGGSIDFWPLNDNDLAGRGREYDLTLIDEGAFTKSPQMLDIWRKSIKPTMLTRRGSSWVFSTPNGVDEDNFFYRACNDAEYGFKQFHAPSSTNPFIPPDELERERLTAHPLVFQQEFLAEFVDWSGVAFFSRDAWLVNDQPVLYPDRCEAVFAVIDTAIKSGKENDCTAVIYFAVNRIYGHPLIILDYDILQIDGSLLESWLPTVYQRLDQLSGLCGARGGSLGAFIEDKGSGTILLQQAAKRGWMAMPIDTELTALGKDERAISTSGYHYQGKCKISQFAYDKLVTVKGISRNHLMTQVLGFRIGDKEAHKRADDLADCYMYGLSIALGDSAGY
jgi:hypothetical protein